MKIIMMTTKSVKPYAKNMKEHTASQIDQLAKSISTFGFNQPIVVDKKGVIIVGHGRFEAAKHLDLKEIPVVVLDIPKEKANTYRIADNKLNESVWNMEFLMEELKDLSTEDLNLSGFDEDFLKEISFNGKNSEINLVDLGEMRNVSFKYADDDYMAVLERLNEAKKDLDLQTNEQVLFKLLQPYE